MVARKAKQEMRLTQAKTMILIEKVIAMGDGSRTIQSEPCSESVVFHWEGPRRDEEVHTNTDLLSNFLGGFRWVVMKH